MHALRTPLAGSWLALTLLAAAAAGGCTSYPTPQDVCDCVNKEADAYTTQYATMLRKVARGDMSAMSEAAGILAKSQELERQLTAYADKASPAQQARFARVQAQAMQTMLRAQK